MKDCGFCRVCVEGPGCHKVPPCLMLPGEHIILNGQHKVKGAGGWDIIGRDA